MSSSERPYSSNVSLCASPSQSHVNTGDDEVSPVPPPVRKSAPAIPRRSTMKRHSFHARPTLPPKVGSKKRKPRPTSIVTAANSRLRSDALSTIDGQLTSKDASMMQRVSSPPPPPPPPPLPPIYAVPAFLPVFDSKRKGLRHFAVRVCKKVEEKGQTTYNEVADELVAEERNYRAQASSPANSSANHSGVSMLSDQAAPLVDEKNIRRRVYDSLNVLMAMQIIGKDKKLISWQGVDIARCVPPVAVDVEVCKDRVEEKRRAIARKVADLERLREQHDRVCALIVKRQSDDELLTGSVTTPTCPRPATSRNPAEELQRVNMPFVLIRASTDAEIKLTMDEAREDVNFSFSSPFSLFDHHEILKRLPLLPELSLSHNLDVT